MRKEALAVKKDEQVSSEKLAKRIAQLILDKKGEDVVVLDIREHSAYADFIIIASARSARHVQGLADHIEEELYKEQISPLGVEGKAEGQWVLMDYGDVIVHLFFEPVREWYDLEGLWMDAPRVDLESWGLSFQAEEEDVED